MNKDELIDALRRLPPAERGEILSEFVDAGGGASAPRVFLSYSRDDTLFVRDLMAGLERGGVRVWFDVRELLIGEDYLVATEKGLRECDFCVVVVSRHSMGSAEVAREMKIARDVGTAILPVILQDTDLPEQLRNLQWIDFRFAFDAPLAFLVAQLRGVRDAGLTEHRLHTATKPLQSPRRYIPLFQASRPASGHWFSALVLISALALVCEGAFFLPTRMFVAFGLFLCFAVLLVVTAFRVAGRRETLAGLRSTLWSYFLTMPAWTAVFCHFAGDRGIRFAVWCAGLFQLAMLAAILVAEYAPDFRRRLRARAETVEFLPQWLRRGATR